MPPSTLLVVAPTTLLVLAAAFIFRARCQHQLQQNQGLLLNEPTSTCSAAGGCGGRDYETIVLQVVESFHLTRTELNSIVKSFIVSFKAGLASPGASISSSLNNISGSGSGSGAGFNDIIEPLPMLPSFVTNLPKGSERGAYLALDLGGTNFRVCLITLDGQHHVAVSQQKYRLPDEMKHGTTPEPLFDFFAQCLASFIDEYSDELDLARYTSSSGTRDRRLKLGFTFSFPLYQSGIAHGVLEYWNKGFNIDGVVGKDVAGLLQQALDRRVGGKRREC